MFLNEMFSTYIRNEIKKPGSVRDIRHAFQQKATAYICTYVVEYSGIWRRKNLELCVCVCVCVCNAAINVQLAPLSSVVVFPAPARAHCPRRTHQNVVTFVLHYQRAVRLSVKIEVFKDCMYRYSTINERVVESRRENHQRADAQQEVR